MPIPKDILDALGAADADFELVGGDEAPETGVSFGRGGEVEPLDRMMQRPIERLDVAMPQLLQRGVVAFRLADPGVILLSLPVEPKHVSGAVRRRDEREYALDARRQAAAVVFSIEGRDTVLAAAPGGGLTIYERDPEFTRTLAKLAYADPGPRTSLPAVDIAAILGGERCEPWLEEAAVTLASAPSVVARAAGVGLVGRLFSPADSPSSALDRAFAGSTVAGRAHSWAAALSGDQRSQLARLAVLEADDLAASLDDVVAAAVRDSENGDAVLDWIHRRDDLASVAFVLDESSEELHRALDAADVAAAEQLSAMSTASVRRDPRVLAVSWQEPECWWGSMAVAG